MVAATPNLCAYAPINSLQVSHPIAQVTMAELIGCKAEVVLIHLNHTNPLLTADSPERAKALAAGFKVSSVCLVSTSFP